MANTPQPSQQQHPQDHPKTLAALQGQYHFDLRALLKEGWQLTQHRKSALILMGLMMFGVALLLYVFLLIGFKVEDYANIPLKTEFSINVILTFLLAPLFAALMLVATRNTVGIVSSSKEITRYLPMMLPLGITSVLTLLIVQAGVFALILPGIYLKIATGFALLLVAEKNMGPTQAIWLSIRVVNRYWMQFVGMYLLFVVMALVVVLTMGIALLWLGPLYLHIKGILYRDMFGLSEQADSDEQGEKHHESVFHA